MKKYITTAIALAVIITGAYLYTSNQPTKVANPLPMPEYGRITVEHAAPLFESGLPDGYAVIDVRPQDEFAGDHTAGVLNIPSQILEDDDNPCEKVASMLPADKKVIFICPCGPRAQEVYDLLTAPVDEVGCGLNKYGKYYLWANIKYRKDRVIVQRTDRKELFEK